MGKKSRLKRESVRYSDAAPELPSWVIAPLAGARTDRDDGDGDSVDGRPDEVGDAREEPRPPAARERARVRDEAVPEA